MTEFGQQRTKIEIKAATFGDLLCALLHGLSDFISRPLIGLFFGLVYVLGGFVIFFGLFEKGWGWMIIPVAIGFPLIAPFIAAGLYDVSRRLEKDEAFTFVDVLTVVWKQQRRELGWMAFTVLFVFWVWMYQVRLLLALFLTRLAFSSVDGVIEAIFSTTDGWLFLGVGTFVGALLSTVLFTITVISMPMLLDHEVDFVTAMITSVKTVAKSPVIMLGWGCAIALIVILSMLPVFLGLLVVLPILGHATWHLYKLLVRFHFENN